MGVNYPNSKDIQITVKNNKDEITEIYNKTIEELNSFNDSRFVSQLTVQELKSIIKKIVAEEISKMPVSVTPAIPIQPAPIRYPWEGPWCIYMEQIIWRKCNDR